METTQEMNTDQAVGVQGWLAQAWAGRRPPAITAGPAEATIGRFKRVVIDDGLPSRTDQCQATKTNVAVAVLNRVLELGGLSAGEKIPH